jgi:c-di-GMP-binding flagellar brake protein YcgR
MKMEHHHLASDFAIHNRKEIVFILDDLAKNHTAINLETSDGVSLLTSVLKVSSEGNYVYLDVGPDNRINDQIIHSKKVKFSIRTGVEVRWHSTHLHRVSLPDGDAFSMTLPAVIERIQRREYFRLRTPQGSNAMICKIPDATEVIEATLVDMSVEGIGVSIKGTLPESFSQGAQLQGCSIEFPVIGVVSISLKLCGIWSSIKTRSGEEVHRIGMEFVNLSRGASNVVQRHMIELEKAQITRPDAA